MFFLPDLGGNIDAVPSRLCAILTVRVGEVFRCFSKMSIKPVGLELLPPARRPVARTRRNPLVPLHVNRIVALLSRPCRCFERLSDLLVEG